MTDDPERRAVSLSGRAWVVGPLFVAAAMAGVDAGLFFRAGSTMMAIRSGRGPSSFNLHYPDIRLAWLVGIVAVVVSAVVLIATRAPNRVIMAVLLVAAVVPLAASVPTSPAHFVFGEPVVVPMDASRFGRAAWLCLATAAAVALAAAVLASGRTRVTKLRSPSSGSPQ